MPFGRTVAGGDKRLVAEVFQDCAVVAEPIMLAVFVAVDILVADTMTDTLIEIGFYVDQISVGIK